MNLSNLPVVLLAILIATVSFALIPVLIILLLSRFFVIILANFLRPDLDQIISGMDAIFAINSTYYPEGCCLVIAFTEGGSFNLQVFRDLFFNKVINFKKDNRFLYQKLQQFWTNFLGFAFWKTDPYFNLKNHIRNFDYKGELALPNPCTQVDIVRLSGQFQNLKFLSKKSPWEILLISNFVSNELEIRSVLLFRLNHILLDGYSFISLIRQLFQLPCEIPKCQILTGKKLSRFEILTLPFQIFYEIANYSVDIFCLRKFNFNRPQGSNICGITEPISMDMVKFIKNKFRVSFSTVINSALAGAIERASKDLNMNVPENLNFAFPIPKPNHPEGLINDIYLGQGIFPIKVQKSSERLAFIQKTTEKNNISKLIATDLTTTLAGILPTVLRTKLKNRLNQNVAVSMSNLPCAGNGKDYRYNDIHLVDLFVFVPGGNHGIVSILSGVKGHVRLGVTMFSPVNANFIWKLTQYVKEELAGMANFKFDEVKSPDLHTI